MTEPAEDPIAALAAQVEDLRGQLARAQGEIGHLRARLEEFAGQDMVQLAAIKQLGEKLDEAIGKRQAADPPAPFWRGLDREAHAARLAELRDFVERFLWPTGRARAPAGTGQLRAPRRSRYPARPARDKAASTACAAAADRYGTATSPPEPKPMAQRTAAEDHAAFTYSELCYSLPYSAVLLPTSDT